jgi:hypothetical protein
MNTESYVILASAIQALIEVVQENEERMDPSKRAALARARRYRVELLTWVDEQRNAGR